MKDKKRIHGFSLTLQLLLITVIPLLILGGVLSVTSRFALERGMKQQTLQGLEGLGASVFTALQEFDYRDLTKNERGIVKKGYYELSGNYELMDSVKANSGIDIAVFFGEELVVSSIKTGAGERCSENFASLEAKKVVLEEGSTYIDEHMEIGGAEYYGYYMPLTNLDGSVAGMLFSGMESSGTKQYIARQVQLVAGVSLFLLAVCVVVSVLFSRSIGKHVLETEYALCQMSEGKLTFVLDGKRRKRSDEIGQMTRELGSCQEKMTQIIKGLKELSGVYLKSGEDLERMAIDTEAASAEIGRSFDDVETGALSQAEDVQKATQHIEAMGSVVSGIVENMDKLGQAAGNMKKESSDSDQLLEELSEFNEKTEEAVSKVDQQIQKTDASVHQIRNAVQLITTIAEETTLLAMNANIEAARAGEFGKGFTVVANEIQKLARQSNHSAEEIEDVLEQLLKNSERTVEIMSSVKDSVQQQKEKLDETKQKIGLVSDGIEASQAEVSKVMQETERCETYQRKAVGIIQGLLAVAEQNAANVEQTTEAMHDLDKTMEVLTTEAENIRSLAESMKKELDYFQTE